jgi:glycosyltransferase involved in cell wall biosynthesis
LALKYVQARSLKKADAAIFLTEYASRVIQKFTGPLKHAVVIPHGVGQLFRQKTAEGKWNGQTEAGIKCLYVSNASMYKHQWHVVKGIRMLRDRGHKISLVLAGGGSGPAQKLLDEEIALTDPKAEFVTQIGFVKHNEIPKLLREADLFIFASSCENMPNTLIEGMASGLPIACSNRGPMPEVLKDGGVYFDPENASSIASAVEQIIADEGKRVTIAQKAKQLSEQYSWARCGRQTWEFLTSVASKNKERIKTK